MNFTDKAELVICPRCKQEIHWIKGKLALHTRKADDQVIICK